MDRPLQNPTSTLQQQYHHRTFTRSNWTAKYSQGETLPWTITLFSSPSSAMRGRVSWSEVCPVRHTYSLLADLRDSKYVYIDASEETPIGNMIEANNGLASIIQHKHCLGLINVAHLSCSWFNRVGNDLASFLCVLVGRSKCVQIVDGVDRATLELCSL